jgi:hypothetical protein
MTTYKWNDKHVSKEVFMSLYAENDKAEVTKKKFFPDLFSSKKKQFTDFTPHFIHHNNTVAKLCAFFNQKVMINSGFMVAEAEIDKTLKGFFDPKTFSDELVKLGWKDLYFCEDYHLKIAVNSIKKPTVMILIRVFYVEKPKEFGEESPSTDSCGSLIGNKGGFVPEENILSSAVTIGFSCIQSLHDKMSKLVNSICDKVKLIDHIAEPTVRDYTDIRYLYPSIAGAASFTKSMKVYPFEDIAGNYTEEVSDKVQWTMDYIKKRESHAGKLFILHGPPGTGKTFAIRSIISDLIGVIGTVFLQPYTCLTNIPIVLEGITGAPYRKLPILIFEDIGELFQKDVKASHPQIATHILNLTDGLLNHIAESYIIVTFNQKIKEMDNALTRPGRTASVIEFGNLPYQQAKTLIADEELSDKLIEREYSLAEVFAIRGGNKELLQKQPSKAGFH